MFHRCPLKKRGFTVADRGEIIGDPSKSTSIADIVNIALFCFDYSNMSYNNPIASMHYILGSCADICTFDLFQVVPLAVL